VKRKRAFLLFILLLALPACHSNPHSGDPRSQRSFNEICALISGKTMVEVEAILGKPNARERLPVGDWRWVWWNYTALKGDSYPPEIRDKPVHLEVVFSRPREAQVADTQWRVDGPLAVSYELPQLPSTGAF
jgi:hypothetical protein